MKTTDTHEIVIEGKDAFGKVFNKLQSGVSGVTGALGSMQAAIGAVVSVGGLTALFNVTSNNIDNLAKLADRTDSTTEGLAALHLQTELNGESTESLDKSLEKMIRSIGEAERGFGTGKKALEELGIPLEDLAGLPADEQFIKIGSAIGGMTDRTKQASLSADIFGRSGIRLLNTFNQGEEGFAKAREEVERLGVAYSRVDAAKVEEANDELLRGRRVVEGMASQFTIGVAPIVGEVARKFSESALSAEEMGEVVEDVMTGGARFVGVFLDGVHGIEIGIKGAELVTKGLATAWFQLANGVIEVSFSIAEAIKDGILFPVTSVLELLAPFSLEAQQALDAINEYEFKPPEALRGTLDTIVADFNETNAELQELLMATLPSAELQATVDSILEGANERANEIAQRVQGANEAGFNDSGDDVATEKEREAHLKKLERLDEQFLTEREKIESNYAEQLALLESKLTTEVDLEGKFAGLRQKIEEDRQKKLNALDKKSAQSRIATTSSMLGNLLSVTGGRSKTLFEINKKFALASAAVALPAAVVETYHKNGGFPFGVVPAGIMAAKGLAEIQQIKSQNFGSGGNYSSSGGSGGFSSGFGGQSTPAPFSDVIQPDEETRSAGSVHFHFPDGLVIGTDVEKNLAEMKRIIVEEEFELIPADSRNGIDLAAAAATV